MSDVGTSSSSGQAAGAADGGRHWHRIGAGVGANLLGKLWVVLGQGLTVPVLLSVWGPRNYGIWLMLCVVPTYVGLSDFGIGSAASVLMTQMIARAEQRNALTVFRSVGALVGLILLALVALCGAGWALLPWICGSLGVPIPGRSLVWAFLLLLLYGVVWVAMMVIQIGYRSTKRYARGTFLLDLALPLETIVMVVAAVATRSFVVCALALLMVRLVAAVAYYARLRHDEPWLRFGLSGVSWSTMRQLFKPALANFALPLGLAMSIQGVVFTIGVAAGPASAGIFAATRTITRIPLQMTGVFARASQPELTIAYSLENKPLLARIVTLNLAITLVSLAPFVLLSPWGDRLLPVISHGRVHVESSLFIAIQAIACLQASSSTFAMFLFAQNKLQRFVPWCLAAGLAEMVAPFAFAKPMSLVGFATALAAIECALLAVVIVVWWRSSSLTVRELAAAVRGWRDLARTPSPVLAPLLVEGAPRADGP